MEFPSHIFLELSFCITSTCLIVGVNSLISWNSNSDHPLPDEVISAFIYGMYLLLCISYTYALLIRPSLDNGLRYRPAMPPEVTWLNRVRLSIICAMFGQAPDRVRMAGVILLNVESIARPAISLSPILHGFFLIANLLCSGIGLDPVIIYLLVKERFSRWESWDTWPPFMWIYGIWKIMKFPLGLVGTILFQYFFSSPSTHLLVAFSCYTVAWLVNLAMVQPSTDLGIFNFLLVNACSSCAVGLFNLGIGTWLVFAACILLYFLREKLDSVTLSYDTWFKPEQDQVLPPLQPSMRSSIVRAIVVPNSPSATLICQTTLELSSTNSLLTNRTHQPTLEQSSTNSPATTVTRQPTLEQSSTNSLSTTLTRQPTLEKPSTNSLLTTLTRQPTLEQSSTNSSFAILTRQPTLDERSSTNSPSTTLTTRKCT